MYYSTLCSAPLADFFLSSVGLERGTLTSAGSWEFSKARHNQGRTFYMSKERRRLSSRTSMQQETFVWRERSLCPTPKLKGERVDARPIVETWAIPLDSPSSRSGLPDFVVSLRKQPFPPPPPVLRLSVTRLRLSHPRPIWLRPQEDKQDLVPQ